MNREPAPSDAPSTGGVRTTVRVMLYVGVLAATVAGVYRITRDDAPPTVMADGMDHSAMLMTGSDAPQPVTLTLDQSNRIGVTYAEATEGPFGKEVRTVGQITLDETRVQSVSTKVDGWVDRLFVNATGQPVRAGAPLFTLYSPMLVQAQEELLLATLLGQQLSGASTDAQGGATTLVESARRRLEYWDIPAADIAAIERSGVMQKVLTIYAPASGYVLEKNVVAGQRIMAGESLYRVADLREVWVEGEVFEQDLADVRVGQTVHADLTAVPGEHRMGRISFVYPTISPETRTARVRVVLANGDLRLKPGMYATLLLDEPARSPVLSVPRLSLIHI